MDFSKIKIAIGNFGELLCEPLRWFCISLKTKIMIILSLSIYVFIGFILQHYYPFPNFIVFTGLFLLIGIITVVCLYYYSKKIPKITNCIIEQPFAREANGIFYAFIQKNVFYVFIPLIVILIFGFGGCRMFTAKKIDISLIWVLGLFCVVVYISIVGYLQYAGLFFYIKKLANSQAPYTNIHHSPNECIPAELEWLQTLTKLYHTYRSAFFTLGSLYILAFYSFCFSPEMKADIKSIDFYILWTIIFIAIVLIFPFTSVLQHYWIKNIVEKLKKQYVDDLTLETEIGILQDSPINNMQIKLFEIMYVSQIINSKDYPVSSHLNTGYNLCASLFNFVATIIAILQGMVIFPIDFHQIF